MKLNLVETWFHKRRQHRNFFLEFQSYSRYFRQKNFNRRCPIDQNTAEFVFFTHCIVGFEPSDFRDTLTPITASLDRVGRWNKDHDTNSRIFPLLCGLSYIVGLCFRISWLDWLKICVILPSAWRKISSFLQSVKEIKPLVFLLLYLSQRKSNWNCREEVLTELPRYAESS